MADPRATDEQQRFWDAATGAGPAAPGGLDPALTEAAGRLRALDRVPPPDPVFAAQLRDELTAAAARSLPQVASRPGGRNERVQLPRRAGLPTWLAGRDRRRWALAQVATAALLVVTVLAAYVAFGPGRPQRVVVPPVAGSPTPATPSPSGVESELMLDPTVASLPAGANVGVDRWSFRPGPDELVMAARSGPTVAQVEVGQLTLRVDGPATLARGPAGQPEPVTPGDELDVAPGDRVEAAAGTGFALRNAGAGPAAALMLYAVPAEEWVEHPFEKFSLYNQMAISHDARAVINDPDLPTGPVRVALERRTLPPGAALDGYPIDGVAAISVESGEMGLTLTGGRVPYPLREGEERIFRGPTFVLQIPNLRGGQVAGLRNAGTEPVVMFELSVVPVAEPT